MCVMRSGQKRDVELNCPRHCWCAGWRIFPKSSEHILQQDRQTSPRGGGKCSPSARHESHLLFLEEIHAEQRFPMLPMTETHPLPKHLQICLSVGSSWTLPFLVCYSKLKIKDLFHISELFFYLVLIVLYEAGIIWHICMKL